MPDLPADKNAAAVAAIKAKIQATFPGMTVRTSGIAAIVPPMNKELSKQLMWGFFEALFWIVLVLAVFFRSIRWALVGVVPNLVPPAVLLGFLSIFNVPIKPGIAIIFSISLGIAFDNTIYILGRLKALLKERPRESTLPIYTLMKKETMPCLVSGMCLFAGFAIFLFSVFPVNRMFGLFVLISIIAGLLGDLVWLPAILKRFPWLLLDSPKSEKIKVFPFNFQETAVRLSPYLLLAALATIAFHNSYAKGETPTVQEILKKVESAGNPKSERVQLKMTIQDSDGSKKERVLTILRKNDEGGRALVRLQKPADLKGLSLLTVVEKGKEDQYLYLPSDKKSRRILGSNKKGKFLDSEIAFEDMSLNTYKEFNNKVVKDDGKLIQIESKAKPGSESSYGKIMTWVTKDDYRLEKVDYYDKAGKLLKQAQFKGYTKVENKYWRAKQLIVSNVQDKRKTTMTMLKVSFKKIDDDEVSLAALED
jgi:predicted exporter